MIKISIIVPVYNKEHELIKCLDSLVNQTLKDIEIIVINDGSTDQSLDVINDYKKQYSNIVVINQKNHGIGYTRNKGLEIARGEYIGFVDSDDYVSLDMYENYYKVATLKNIDIVTSNYYKVNSEIKEFKNDYFEKGNINTNPGIINLIDYGAWNKIFKRQLIIQNNIKFEEKLKYEDMPFTARAVSLAQSICHLNKPYYYYSIHQNSETTTIDSRVFDIFDIMNIVNNVYKELANTQELEYLNITKITTYLLMQKHQIEFKTKIDFIEKGYNYLNSKFPKWKSNCYYKKNSILKRLIKNNKVLLKLYCKG